MPPLKKKSAAQIRRLQERALARGEEYVVTVPAEASAHSSSIENKGTATTTATIDTATTTTETSVPTKATDDDDKRMKIATRLSKELSEIEQNSSHLSSKERRSAKRKAEAIAAEEAGIPTVELMEWYNNNKEKQQSLNEPTVTTPANSSSTKQLDDETTTTTTKRRELAAKKLKQEMESIDGNDGMKAKDRRSAKRKAEAVALEESGMAAQDLLSWYETYLLTSSKADGNTNNKNNDNNTPSKRSHDPYIAFVGQLSFDTTPDDLYQHIYEHLKKEFQFQRQDIQIRILTDSVTKKSRGMAFVEVQDPEILYGLLKLHQTFLMGRRVNIERSAGGKKNSEHRKAKLTQFRKEQEEYFADVVDKILKEYKDRGELRQDELDDGVIALCKRHAGPVVQASIAEYIEKGGRDMDNPSAYLSFLITKFATEGIRDKDDEDGNKDKNKDSKNNKRKRKDDFTTTKSQQPKSKLRRKDNDGGGSRSNNGNNNNNNNNNNTKTTAAKKSSTREPSEFQRAGIDMSMSEKQPSHHPQNDLVKVFPSARRGRGRGYM